LYSGLNLFDTAQSTNTETYMQNQVTTWLFESGRGAVSINFMFVFRFVLVFFNKKLNNAHKGGFDANKGK
jgi:hypothetical protein